MDILDFHLHAYRTEPDPASLLARLKEAGLSGACIISNRPHELGAGVGSSFEERLEELEGWTKDFRDVFYPVLWVHPYEKDIIQKVRKNSDKADAYKMICSNYYVYDEPSMRLIREIASLGKPIIFHTGILWDGKVSSNYNRPLNWEHLLEIKGLKFSMGHCSWPWIDECIALYGKFLNSLIVGNGENAEMFFDLTPGTPEIYRKELLTKLMTVGYDVADNIVFGTDSSAGDYSVDWAKNWIGIDNAVYDELQISQRIRRKIFRDNALRFLGKIPDTKKHVSPEYDKCSRFDINETI